MRIIGSLLIILAFNSAFADSVDSIDKAANRYCARAPRYFATSEMNEEQLKKIRAETAVYNYWCQPKVGFTVDKSVSFPDSSLLKLSAVIDSWQAIDSIFTGNDPEMQHQMIVAEKQSLNITNGLLYTEIQNRVGKLYDGYKSLTATELDTKMRALGFAARSTNINIRKANW